MQFEMTWIMSLFQRILFILLTLFFANAWGQSIERQPHIGYLFPAGGQRGTVMQITTGGQYLRGVTNVYVSGEGVSATVVQYVPPLTRKQLQDIQKKLNELRQKRTASTSPRKESSSNAIDTSTLPMLKQSTSFMNIPSLNPVRNFSTATEEQQRFTPAISNGVNQETTNFSTAAPANNTQTNANTTMNEIILPDHPLLRNLENLSPKELQKVVRELVALNKKQQDKEASISEIVILEININPNVAPGVRELRLQTPLGLTNPLCFCVGLLPEFTEEEPNEPDSPVTSILDIPVVLNGQIKEGDVDRFHFKAHQGQHLIIEAHVRSLIPYLADAVPGWFQAALTLYDAKGNEVAFADHYRFNPDPVICYLVPKDDIYQLEIRDTIYRGRDDFVYRITIGEQPFITGLYPLGSRAGFSTIASITGWNLTNNELTLDTRLGTDWVRQTTVRQNELVSNQVTYAIDTLSERFEIEHNDTFRQAQMVTLPKVINGRISQPGDVDMFCFEGKAGDEIVAEVYARRLQSPLDSQLRLMDAKGRVLGKNDDYEDKEFGLLTQHTDSYSHTRMPADGIYYIQLSDSQNHGGIEYTYRLRIGPPQPDFALRLTPSSINIPAGRTIPINVYAIRKDGFNGDIYVVLKDTTAGIRLSGGRIPSGQDQVRMTLTATRESSEQPIVVELEGLARIGEQMISRPVVPAEDMMQAFAYRHLVPSQELLVAVTENKRRGPFIEPVNGSILIPEGGSTQVIFKIPPRANLGNIKLKLDEPPKGISLRDVSIEQGQLTFMLATDSKEFKTGYKDNLIIEAFVEFDRVGKDGKKSGAKQQVSLGILPALPIDIVE